MAGTGGGRYTWRMEEGYGLEYTPPPARRARPVLVPLRQFQQPRTEPSLAPVCAVMILSAAAVAFNLPSEQTLPPIDLPQPRFETRTQASVPPAAAGPESWRAAGEPVSSPRPLSGDVLAAWPEDSLGLAATRQDTVFAGAQPSPQRGRLSGFPAGARPLEQRHRAKGP